MKKIILYVTGGLSNRVFPLASVLEFTKITNRELFVYWPIDNRCGANFKDLYKDNNISFIDDDFLNSLDDSKTKYYSEFEDGVLNDFNVYHRNFLFNKYKAQKLIVGALNFDLDVENICFTSNTFLNFVSLEISKNILKNFKVIDECLEKIEYFKNLLNLDEHIVGAHIRGCDFSISLDYYVNKIQNILSNNKSQKIFICSDDNDFEKSLLTMFSDNIIIRQNKKYVNKKNVNSGWIHNTDTDIDCMKEAIIDLFLLSKTNFLIYNNSSTFAKYVQILSEDSVKLYKGV